MDAEEKARRQRGGNRPGGGFLYQVESVVARFRRGPERGMEAEVELSLFGFSFVRS